jgi:hypothetical protein
MDDARLLKFATATTAAGIAQSGALLALERVVMALIATHPDRESLLVLIEKSFEIGAVDELNQPIDEQLLAAYQAKRDRLKTAIESVSRTPPMSD